MKPKDMRNIHILHDNSNKMLCLSQVEMSYMAFSVLIIAADPFLPENACPSAFVQKGLYLATVTGKLACQTATKVLLLKAMLLDNPVID